MSAIAPCVPCCATSTPVQIPGVEGLPGIDGANGVSAFTATTSPKVLQAVNATQTFDVLNSDWMAIGEFLFVSDGTDWGTFQVTAIPTSTSVTLKFLGRPGDASPGVTIDAAAVVTPTGAMFSTPAPTSKYGSGTVYEMTATPAQLAVGTNPPTITLPATGNFLLYAMANIKFLSVTWAANHTADVHIRRTNNTPADLAPAMTLTTPIITTITDEFGLFNLPPIYYAGTSGDVLELWGSLSAVPDNNAAGAHAVQVTQTAIMAVQLS